MNKIVVRVNVNGCSGTGTLHMFISFLDKSYLGTRILTDILESFLPF